MARFNAYGYHDELRKKRKRREKRIAFLIIFSFVGLILFLTYALIFSGWLSIKEIKISGHQEISEEEMYRLEKEIQKVTDEIIGKIDEMGRIKEEEMMQI